MPYRSPGPIYGCMEWFYVLAALLAALGPFMSGLAAVFALKKGPGVNSALLKKSSAGQVVPPFAECLSLKRLQCFAFRNLLLKKKIRWSDILSDGHLLMLEGAQLVHPLLRLLLVALTRAHSRQVLPFPLAADS